MKNIIILFKNLKKKISFEYSIKTQITRLNKHWEIKIIFLIHYCIFTNICILYTIKKLRKKFIIF